MIVGKRELGSFVGVKVDMVVVVGTQRQARELRCFRKLSSSIPWDI